MGKCRAATHKLNCGCCDEVTLRCDLNADHPSEWHEDRRYDYGDYVIMWRDKKESD